MKSETEQNNFKKIINNKSVEIDKQNKLIQELRLKIIENENIKKEADKRIKELAEDLNTLYNENKKLTKIAKNIYSEIFKSKDQELIDEQNSHSNFCLKELEENKKPYNKKIMEIGKKKVKVPTLDFTQLAQKKLAKLKVVQYYKGEEGENEVEDPEDEEESVVEYNIEDIHADSESQNDFIEGIFFNI